MHDSICNEGLYIVIGNLSYKLNNLVHVLFKIGSMKNILKEINSVFEFKVKNKQVSIFT